MSILASLDSSSDSAAFVPIGGSPVSTKARRAVDWLFLSLGAAATLLFPFELLGAGGLPSALAARRCCFCSCCCWFCGRTVTRVVSLSVASSFCERCGRRDNEMPDAGRCCCCWWWWWWRCGGLLVSASSAVPAAVSVSSSSAAIIMRRRLCRRCAIRFSDSFRSLGGGGGAGGAESLVNESPPPPFVSLTARRVRCRCRLSSRSARSSSPRCSAALGSACFECFLSSPPAACRDDLRRRRALSSSVVRSLVLLAPPPPPLLGRCRVLWLSSSTTVSLLLLLFSAVGRCLKGLTTSERGDALVTVEWRRWWCAVARSRPSSLPFAFKCAASAASSRSLFSRSRFSRLSRRSRRSRFACCCLRRSALPFAVSQSSLVFLFDWDTTVGVGCGGSKALLRLASDVWWEWPRLLLLLLLLLLSSLSLWLSFADKKSRCEGRRLDIKLSLLSWSARKAKDSMRSLWWWRWWFDCDDDDSESFALLDDDVRAPAVRVVVVLNDVKDISFAFLSLSLSLSHSLTHSLTLFFQFI